MVPLPGSYKRPNPAGPHPGPRLASILGAVRSCVMRIATPFIPAAALAAVLSVACATSPPAASPATSATPAARSHDRRHFTVDEALLPFEALEVPTTTDRWWGVESGAGYRIEVPANWNGRLVMYAHGYRGPGEVLTPSVPHFRRALIEAGYAWAASMSARRKCGTDGVSTSPGPR